jgi:hypothetical protein
MAVKIDIPEFGTVIAENAASEDTLLAILAAMNSTSGKKGKADKEAEEAAKGKADADKKATKASKDFNVGLNAAADGAAKALKNIGLTAVSLVTNFATNFAEIANNPIKETAKVLDTLIDGVAKTATSLTDAIPVVGGFISAMINATAELAKAANKTFADQLQKNIDSLQAYNKVGVSFAGSMNQMNKIAHSAGLGIEDFSKIVSKSKHDLNFLGSSGGAAAIALSNGMGLTAKLIGKSGQTLRNEMFKMGYSYEEQGEVMASYMANMKASGRLEKMTREDLARGTRQYAADLKVLADFTGQDAKKLMERGRQQALLLTAQQRLDAKQRGALGDTTAALGKMGSGAEEARQAVTQILMKGATNVQGYTMGPGRKFAETLAAQIKAGKGGADAVNDAMAELQQGLQKNKQIGAMVDAQIMNSGSDASNGFAKLASAAFENGIVIKGATKASREAAEAEATNKDKTADQTAALYDQTKKQQVEMEILVNTHMDKYASLLKEVNDQLGGNFMKFITEVNTTGESKEATVNRGRKELKNLFRSDDVVLKRQRRDDWLLKNGYEKEQSGMTFDKNGKLLAVDDVPGIPKFDKGGRLGAGRFGIAGENGPELIGGPASILSTATTEKLITALDAMREMSGNRFGDSGIDQQVGIGSGRMGKLRDRVRGFEGFDYKQLESELNTRPENAPIQAVKDQWDREERESNAEATSHLAELVRLMKQNVGHTAKVASNTN